VRGLVKVVEKGEAINSLCRVVSRECNGRMEKSPTVEENR